LVGICKRFASDQADVVVTDIDRGSIEKVSREVEGLGSKSLQICADVSIKSSVEEMVPELSRNGGN